MPRNLEIDMPRKMEMEKPQILEILHATHSGQDVKQEKHLCRKNWTGLTGCVCHRYWKELKQDFGEWFIEERDL